MKIQLLLPSAVCGLSLLSGCVYDEGYGVRRVSVSTGTPYYYGDYDEYTPYYSHSGRRYYQSNGRYVYYANRRPYYVASLPSRAVYTTPPRRISGSVGVTSRRVVRHHRHHDDD